MNSVFIVSDKRKLLGDKMIEYLNRTGRKPGLNDADETAKHLTDDWALFTGSGYDEEEKKEYYEELSKDALKKRSERLVVASYMQAPMDLMINTVTRNSSLLSCNKAIEKSGSASKEVIDLLKRILAATETDENRERAEPNL